MWRLQQCLDRERVRSPSKVWFAPMKSQKRTAGASPFRRTQRRATKFCRTSGVLLQWNSSRPSSKDPFKIKEMKELEDLRLDAFSPKIDARSTEFSNAERIRKATLRSAAGPRNSDAPRWQPEPKPRDPAVRRPRPVEVQNTFARDS